MKRRLARPSNATCDNNSNKFNRPFLSIILHKEGKKDVQGATEFSVKVTAARILKTFFFRPHGPPLFPTVSSRLDVPQVSVSSMVSFCGFLL